MSGESGESSVTSPQSPGKVSPRPRFTDSEYLMILGERELRIEERDREIATLRWTLGVAREEVAAARRELAELRAASLQSSVPSPQSPERETGESTVHSIQSPVGEVAREWGQIVRERMAEYSTVEHTGSPEHCA